MKIDLSGHHVQITDAIREAVSNKFKKVQSHFPDLGHISVILTVEPSAQIVEVSAQYRGAAIAVKASDRDLYIAIRDAEKKLAAALSHRKGATGHINHDKTVGSV